MFDYSFKAGTTSQRIQVMLRDSTTGGGKTGVAYTAVTASYTLEGGTRTAITLASGTAGDAFSAGKWAEVDATNCKGLYQLHVPDAALASGKYSTINLQATGVIDKAVAIELVAVNAYSATAFITAINSVAPPTNWNLASIDASGRVDVAKLAGQTITAAAGVTFPSSIASPTNITAATGVVLSGVTHTGAVIPTVTTVTNQLTAAAIATGVWQDSTAGDFTAASSIGKALYVSNVAPGGAGGHLIAGSNAATTFATLTSTGAFTINGTSNVAQTGDSFALIGTAGAGLTALGDTRIANLDATVSSASGGLLTRTFQRKYATGAGNSVGIQIPLAGSSTYATSSDWTPATGDVKISKDGGAEANIASLPSYSNGWWYFAFSNTELTAKRIYVRVSDTAPKAVKDVSFVVDTYGNASAQIIQDLGAANWQADIKAYDGVAQTPSASGYPDVNLVAIGGVGFALDDIAHIAYQGKRMLFVSTAGSSGNDGLSPSTAKALISEAISIASAGDVILVEAGTYDQVTTVVDVPDDVTIIGAGWQRTIVNSQVTNVTPNFRSIVEPGSRCKVKGIAFIGNYTGNSAQRGVGVGSGSGAFTDAVFEDCRFFGNVDGLQIAKLGATNSAKFYRCRFESGFDAVAISYGTNTLEFYDCEFLADAAWLPVGYTSAGLICRGIVAATSTTSKLSVHNGRFLAQGGSDTNTGVQVSGSASTVNVFGGWFNCAIYDLEQTNGTLNAFNVPYDSSKISGTIGKFEMPEIKAKTDQLTFTTPNVVDSSATIAASSIRAALGMAAADMDTQLDAIYAVASTGSGSGARTVTITVNDGTTALQNAIVRMTEGVNTYTASTNVSGVATFNLDDATYTVAISKSGYSFSGTTLAVNATTSHTYSMTAISITPPSDPALTAAYLTTYDAQGGIAGSTVISFKLEDGAGTTGYSYSTTTFTGTSNASTGLLTINLVKSTSYSARRGNGEWVDFTTGSGSTYALPEVLGTP